MHFNNSIVLKTKLVM